MAVNISTWSIRHPVPVALLFVLLLALGGMAFTRLTVQNFPDIDLPAVAITATLPGASPAQLETEVARHIENALATVQGLKHLQTRLTDGSAQITAEFHLEKPPQEALDEVRDAVARVRGDLPADLRDPVIRKLALAGSPVLTYTVAAKAGAAHLDAQALSWFIDNELSKALLAVPGVGAVTRLGGVERELRVALDPARLLALNTTAAEVSRPLRQLLQEASGGRVDLGGAEQPVRTLSAFQAEPTQAGQSAQGGPGAQPAQALAALELTLADGRRVRLGQLATVSDTVAEPRSAAFLDGLPVVGVEVGRARGHGELAVAEGVRRAVAALALRHPELQLQEAVNFIDPIVENYQGSLRLLVEGAVLAVLVVALFLRNARATVVAAVALPLSVIPTFALMQVLGFSLNTVTLLSLSLVVGVLVDDAIVEIENIQRHLLMGKSPRQAAMEAADEIGLAVIATTFTLVAVFLPTAFMSGTVGKFFVQFGWTAAGAVVFSLLVARMLTPLMAAWLLRPPLPDARPVQDPAWLRPVLAALRWCLAHRAATLALAAGFFAGGVGLATALPATFIPPDDGAQTQVSLTLPPGSRLEDTVALAEQARLLLRQSPQVLDVFTAVGTGGGGGGEGPDASPAAEASVRNALLTLRLTPRRQRPGGLSQQAVEQALRADLAGLPGVRVQVGQGGSGTRYQLVLAGEDGARLARHARLVERELRGLPGLGAVTSSAALLRPELSVRLDPARAADLGVSPGAVADTLRVATLGDYDQALARLSLGERQVPVRVRLDEAGRQSLDLIRRLPVPGARGPVPLENVATLALDSGPAEIQRQDRQRHVTLEIEAAGQPLGEIERAVLALPSLRNLPAGITRGVQGEAEDLQQLATGFALAMLTGVLCIYLVLVLLLKDFVQPATILTALVLSVPGAVLALFLTGASLSMPSMIGLVMLMGVATKNAILLVDYILMARQGQGQGRRLARRAAILDACRKRARPIVMTTLAMGAGMLPVALGWVGDPSFRVPMAVVVIGGLLSSTVLSLLVVPVVYSVLDDARVGVGRWLSRRRAGA